MYWNLVLGFVFGRNEIKKEGKGKGIKFCFRYFKRDMFLRYLSRNGLECGVNKEMEFNEWSGFGILEW